MQALVRVCLRWGLIAGALTTALMIATYYIAFHPFMVAPFLDFRILIFAVFIFFALKEFRDYVQGGMLYFWQGLIGFMIVVIVSLLISSIGLYIFGSFVPEFMTDYISKATEYLKTFPAESIEQIGKENYERNLETISATNLGVMTITYFVHGIPIGVFIGVILSVVLRRAT